MPTMKMFGSTSRLSIESDNSITFPALDDHFLAMHEGRRCVDIAGDSNNGVCCDGFPELPNTGAMARLNEKKT